MFGTEANHVWYDGKPCLVRRQTTVGTVANHVWYGDIPYLVRRHIMYTLPAQSGRLVIISPPFAASPQRDGPANRQAGLASGDAAGGGGKCW